MMKSRLLSLRLAVLGRTLGLLLDLVLLESEVLVVFEWLADLADLIELALLVVLVAVFLGGG